jgi:hypothetical protein
METIERTLATRRVLISSRHTQHRTIELVNRGVRFRVRTGSREQVPLERSDRVNDDLSKANIQLERRRRRNKSKENKNTNIANVLRSRTALILMLRTNVSSMVSACIN